MCHIWIALPLAPPSSAGMQAGMRISPPRGTLRSLPDKPMEKAKINFDWPLDLLRSETVKVYVNNEINILVLFWAKWGSILIQMCFGLKNSFVNLGMSFFILLYNFCYFISFFFPVIPKTFWN